MSLACSQNLRTKARTPTAMIDLPIDFFHGHPLRMSMRLMFEHPVLTVIGWADRISPESLSSRTDMWRKFSYDVYNIYGDVSYTSGCCTYFFVI